MLLIAMLAKPFFFENESRSSLLAGCWWLRRRQLGRCGFVVLWSNSIWIRGRLLDRQRLDSSRTRSRTLVSARENPDERFFARE